MKILFGELAKEYERFKKKQKRKTDEEYIASLIIRYCKERGCVGISYPHIEGIIKFNFDEYKKNYGK